MPAGWYADRFMDATAPRTPNWNAKNTEHHGFVSTNPSLNDSNSGDAVMFIDQLYRDRLRTLLSVDDIVYELFELLNKYPSELNNTVVVLTSDHGYDLGQLRIPCSKQEPYETAIRIPMFMYGPDNLISKKGVKNKGIVGNIDLLPTFLDIAGIKYNINDYDGKSWYGHFIGENVDNFDYDLSAWNRDIYLSQYQSVGTYYFDHCNTWFPSNDGSVVPGNNTKPPPMNLVNETWFVDDKETNNWRALRIINESMDIMYVEFVNSSWNATFDKPIFYEFYNMTNDFWQTNNLYNTMDKNMQNTLHTMLMKYGQCKGSECW